MNLRRLLSAGSASSLAVGLLLCLTLVSAGVTREAPVGQLTGKVSMEENGKPLPEAEVVLRPVEEFYVDREKAIEEGIPRYRYARTEDDGTFRIRSVAAGKYMLEAYGEAHQMEAIPVEVVEGRKNDFSLVLEPRLPSLDLYASQHVFMPSEKIDFDLHGFVDADKVKLEVFKLRFEDVLKQGSVYSALAPLARRDGAVQDPASVGAKISEKTDPIKGRDVEGTFRLNLSLDPLKQGLYWVRCTVGDISTGTYFNITEVGLVVKRARTDVLAFAARLDNGAPVSGVSVGYVKDGAFVTSGSTDRDGLARFKLAADLPEKNSVVVGRKGEASAFVDFYFNKGSSEAGRIVVYSDRPVYRPGDEVHYKGIVRSLQGTEYKVPPPSPVQIEVRDADESLIDTRTLQTSPSGTFHGSFKTHAEAAPGSFRMEAHYGGIEGDASFEIAAYRKPNYSVKVRPEKPHYIRGEKVRMIVECQYYFGGPVGGAKVEGSVSRSPMWSYYDPDDEYGYEEYSYGGEWVSDVEGVTDSSGKCVLEFDTRAEGEDAKSWSDSEFTLTASVSDEAGAFFDGSGSAKVTAGDFSIRSEASHYVVEKGQPFEVTFESKDPVTGEAAPNKTLKVVAGHEFWDGLTTEFKPFAERTLDTGQDGTASVVVTPLKGGSVIVRATSRDDHGNELEASTFVWCSSRGESERIPPQESLSIRLDKKRYDPGEKAKLLILAPEGRGTALVTVEAEKMHKVQMVRLDGSSTTLDLPVSPGYAPNVYVNVCYVWEKQFRQAQRRLTVDLGRKTLQVRVESDKETYEPGDTATYSISTKDSNGRPHPAEVSLSVVDEAIYAIREDDTDLAGSFYPKRYNEVSTDYSFTTLYLDGGDKAPPEMEIRRVFKDTAFWDPVVQTDGAGIAIVSVKLPDNLTTWRATVQAVDGSTAVGEDASTAIARKRLMVRLQTPSFYISGDTQRLAASVTNYTGRAASVNVELTLEGVSAKEDKRQSIQLKEGETKALEWNVTAGDPGTAVYTARAWIDEATTDGVEGRVPIHARGRTEKSSITGDVVNTAIVKIQVDESADRVSGGLALTLSPNLAAPLLQSLDDLIGFPYGCVEQTTSRFMPTVVAAKVVKDLGLPAPRQASQIPAIVAESYARLARMQSYKGGWGWWESDDPDSYMTAYVLEGVYRGRQAGYPEKGVDVKGALKWAADEVKKTISPPMQKGERWEVQNDLWRFKHAASERARLANALALFGRRDHAAVALNSFPLTMDLPVAASAEVVLACQALGPDFTAKRDEALRLMKGLARRSAGTVSWEEWYWGVETTARCLQALVAVNPSDPLIPGAIRYLMLSRRGDFWTSTRDTAIAILAISDYLRAQHAVIGEAAIGIKVNGKSLGVASFTPQSINEAAKRIEIPMRLLHSGENTIELTKTGPGSCYYSAELVQTLVWSDLPAFSNLEGVSILRSYHRLVQEKLQDGRMKLVPSKEPVSRFEPGELVRCLLTIKSESRREFLQIEDPIPSSCRVVEREDLDLGEEWDFWWSSLKIRDDRVAYFARSIDKGTFTLEYTMRAEQPGASAALPASVCEMYEPSKRAWTGVSKLEVRR